VLEHALPVDYALLRGFRADKSGNVEFRGSSIHFNPVFAKAAKVAIIEVDYIVEVGEIPPERVGLPGIFVSRVVLSTKKPAGAKGGLGRRARTAAANISVAGPLTPGACRARRSFAAQGRLREPRIRKLPTLVASHRGQ